MWDTMDWLFASPGSYWAVTCWMLLAFVLLVAWDFAFMSATFDRIIAHARKLDEQKVERSRTLARLDRLPWPAMFVMLLAYALLETFVFCWLLGSVRAWVVVPSLHDEAPIILGMALFVAGPLFGLAHRDRIRPLWIVVPVQGVGGLLYAALFLKLGGWNGSFALALFGTAAVHAAGNMWGRSIICRLLSSRFDRLEVPATKSG